VAITYVNRPARPVDGRPAGHQSRHLFSFAIWEMASAGGTPSVWSSDRLATLASSFTAFHRPRRFFTWVMPTQVAR